MKRNLILALMILGMGALIFLSVPLPCLSQGWGGGGSKTPSTDEGKDAPAATSTVKLDPVSWANNPTDGLQQAKTDGTPVLFFFTNEENKSLANDAKLAKDTKVTCIMVIFQADKTDKEKDELYQVNQILKTAGSPEKGAENISESVKLGVKYKITSLPQTLWVDCCGNDLQKGSVKAFSDKSGTALNKEAATALEKQKKREVELTKQYNAIEKQIETEREKKVFSPELIAKVQQIAKYEGWDQAVKARAVVDEINGVAEKELEQILAQSNNPDVKKEKVIGDLNKFNGKYKGLPVTKTSQDKLKELTKKDTGDQKKDK